jgi:hypothetical protein
VSGGLNCARRFDTLEPGRAGDRRPDVCSHVHVHQVGAELVATCCAPPWVDCSATGSRWHRPSSIASTTSAAALRTAAPAVSIGRWAYCWMAWPCAAHCGPVQGHCGLRTCWPRVAWCIRSCRLPGARFRRHTRTASTPPPEWLGPRFGHAPQSPTSSARCWYSRRSRVRAAAVRSDTGPWFRSASTWAAA